MSAGEGRDRGQAERQRDRAANPDRERPDLQCQPWRTQTDGGRQHEGVERRHLADPHRGEAVAPRLEGCLDDLAVGPVKPKGRHDIELAPLH